MNMYFIYFFIGLPINKFDFENVIVDLHVTFFLNRYKCMRRLLKLSNVGMGQTLDGWPLVAFQLEHLHASKAVGPECGRYLVVVHSSS